MKKKGKLIVVSAPSGCGKTTIARAILEKYPDFLFSVSATTRLSRNGEIDGRDYFFLTKEDFQKKIKDAQLVEWEEIYGNYYGTLKAEVELALSQGKVMLFDIDVKGALSIRKMFPEDSVLIFIEPPSIGELTKRLRNRQTEDAEALARRLDRVSMELDQGRAFDYRVVNDDLNRAIHEVETIIKNIFKLESMKS